MEGDKLVLEAELSKPDFPVVWKKDGVEVKPSDRVKLVVDGLIHRLEIDAVDIDDEANFSIHAADKSCKALVLVEGRNVCLPIVQVFIIFSKFYGTRYLFLNSQSDTKLYQRYCIYEYDRLSNLIAYL